jgi:hypothetical protein
MTDRTISARSPAASPGREVRGDLGGEPEAMVQPQVSPLQKLPGS